MKNKLMSMKKCLLVLLSLFLSLTIYAQQNLIEDGSFESSQVVQENEIARIAAFSDFGNKTQRTNPTQDAPMDVERGVWYKKSANSGYLRAVVINTDAYDGEKAMSLTIRENSPQPGLTNWYGLGLTQYVKVNRGKPYILRFCAKSTAGSKRIYAAMVSESGGTAKGSKWLDIDSDWTEYEVVISPSDNSSAVVLGLGTTYNDDKKTNKSSVIIDDVRLYQK